MFKKPTSLSPPKEKYFRINSIEHDSPSLFKSTQSTCTQTDVIEKCSKSTNRSNCLEDMLIQGKNMNDDEFEKFVKGKEKAEYDIQSKLTFVRFFYINI